MSGKKDDTSTPSFMPDLDIPSGLLSDLPIDTTTEDPLFTPMNIGDSDEFSRALNMPPDAKGLGSFNPSLFGAPEPPELSPFSGLNPPMPEPPQDIGRLPPVASNNSSFTATNVGTMSGGIREVVMGRQVPAPTDAKLQGAPFDAKIVGGASSSTRPFPSSGGSFSGLAMMNALPTGNVATFGEKNAPYITTMNSNTQRLTGFDKYVSHNIKSKFSKILGRQATAEFSLGRPSVLPGQKHFIVGTDSPDSKESYLLCLNSDKFYGENPKPIVSHLQVKDHVRDVHWVAEKIIVCATGHDVQIMEVQADFEIKLRGTRRLHHDLIREVAPSPNKPLEVASGGFDKKLCINDLVKGVQLCEKTMSDTIGSVKFQASSNGNVVGCTLDYGGLFLFDKREGLRKHIYSVNTGKPDMYTHCCLNDNTIMLGYGDASLQIVDQRYKRTVLVRSQDPYVDAVGDIDYNIVTDTFVVSGLTDFTVWKRDTQSKTATPWSHMGSSKTKFENKFQYATATCYLDPDTVIMCDRNGYAGIYKQGFK